MKGPETSMSLLTRNLFYLYEGLRDVFIYKTSMRPPEASQRRICSTYMKGSRDLHEPPNKEFVPYMKGPIRSKRFVLPI